MKKNPSVRRLVKEVGENIKLRRLVMNVSTPSHRDRYPTYKRARRLAKSFYQKLVDRK